MENLSRLLKLARENSRNNPSLKNKQHAMRVYLQGLKDEIAEVEAETKPSNSVYLTDELSDIVWDFFNLLASLESAGYIESAEDVFSRGLKKYSQRSKAMKNADE